MRSDRKFTYRDTDRTGNDTRLIARLRRERPELEIAKGKWTHEPCCESFHGGRCDCFCRVRIGDEVF
jgi:hypothetical protein